MVLKEIVDQERWNSFVVTCRPVTFLQSWEWGQAQTAAGTKARYLGCLANGELVGAALVLTVNAKRGNYYLVPHGPVARSAQTAKELLPKLLTYLRENREDGVSAVRLSPLLISSPRTLVYLKSLGMRPAPTHVHAELTWVLDISGSEEEIIAGMRKTTRHAIRKAAANPEIKVKLLPAKEALARFWQLYGKTAKRHNFVPWSYEMLRAQVDVFGADEQMFAVMATYREEDVAGAMLIHFGKTVYYYHGASKKLPSYLPVNQLVQWTAIKEAKIRRADSYNFWGIAPDNEPNHPFVGLTTFKKGFGGCALDFTHAHDLPLSLSYYRLWAIDRWQKWRRGF